MLRLDGWGEFPKAAWWTSTTVVVARSRCRLRWFRLSGVPAAERLSALRLQVQAWSPFDQTAARLVLNGEQGLAIAWDAAAVAQAMQDAGLPAERTACVPEVLLQPAGSNGLRLVRAAEGYEAQRWQDGFLVASRWWADALSPRDWQEFVHASGVDGMDDAVLPAPEDVAAAAKPWMRHHPLHASADGAAARERQLVFGGALGLALATGLMAHQWWAAHRQADALARQIAEVKQSMQPTLLARDAALAAVADVDRLAAWFALPLPVDVLGHLHEVLAKSGALVKDLELEGDKLRLSLQLSPNATRAGIVKDLQSGGWLTDVAEVRADNARGLLTMDMKIATVRPPVMAAGGNGDAQTPPGGSAAKPAQVPVAVNAAPLPAPAAAPAPARAPAVAPAPVPVAAVPAPPPARKGPPKPIIATPDANGMPPAEVFNAIPNR